MNNLIRKKVILCLLDSGPKSADEIAGEVGESLATVEDELTVYCHRKFGPPSKPRL